MLDEIRRFPAAPLFEDEAEARQSRLLNIISLAMLGLAIAGTIILLALAFSLRNLAIGVGFIALEAVVQLLLRSRLVRFAGVAQIAVLWVGLTYMNYTAGGLRSATADSYVLVVLVAGLLLGSRSGIGVAALSAIAAGAMLYFSLNTALPAYEPRPDVVLWVTQAAHFFLSAIMVHLAIRGVQDALDRSRQVNKELRNTQKELNERILGEQQQRQQMQQLMQVEQEQRESLQHILAQVREAADSLNAAATEILATTTQQASGATQQSAAINQATITIEEVRTIAEQTAQLAQGVADLVQQTTQIAQAGQRAVHEVTQGMEEVKAKVETIAANILDLSEQAQQIGQIVTSVRAIASQSHMLALNASVEAARAGETGKGFAVVAQEVRTLAKQSRDATEQVSEILAEIQRGVNTSVMATEEGIKGVAAGVSLTSEAGLAIQQLADSVTESTQAALKISAAVGQQLTGVEQVVAAMENINQVTAQSVAGAHQVEQAVQGLNAMANELRDLIAEHRPVA